MSLIDDIEDLIRRKPDLTERELADELFPEAYQQRVNGPCRQLLAQGRVERIGRGGVNDTYRYRITGRSKAGA